MLKEYTRFNSNNQIWRLLISSDDVILIETRDTDKKEVFFNTLDLKKETKDLRNLQLEEKYWIGVETIIDDKIIFHKYAKPDMPGHSQIIVYDIAEERVLWKNEALKFLGRSKENIYCIRNSMMGRNCYEVNLYDGSIINDLGSDEELIDEIVRNSSEGNDYSQYKYAEKYYSGVDDGLDNIFSNYTSGLSLEGSLDYLIWNDLLLFNIHKKIEEENVENLFFAFDLKLNKEILNIRLNKNLNAYAPDSFFIYKDKLILLKDKKEVIIYNKSN